MASEPYSALEGPFTISIRSISLMLILSIPFLFPNPLESASLIIRRPSIKISVLSLSTPRIITSCPPPRTAVFNIIPVSCLKRLRKSYAPDRLISFCVITCIVTGTFSNVFSVCVAVTTTSGSINTSFASLCDTVAANAHNKKAPNLIFFIKISSLY